MVCCTTIYTFGKTHTTNIPLRYLLCRADEILQHASKIQSLISNLVHMVASVYYDRDYSRVSHQKPHDHRIQLRLWAANILIGSKLIILILILELTKLFCYFSISYIHSFVQYCQYANIWQGKLQGIYANFVHIIIQGYLLSPGEVNKARVLLYQQSREQL